MEGAIKRMEEMEKEGGRNLCKSDCKIPDGNSGALISRLCWSLDSNGIVFYLTLSVFSLFFSFFRSWDIRFVCAEKNVLRYFWVTFGFS